MAGDRAVLLRAAAVWARRLTAPLPAGALAAASEAAVQLQLRLQMQASEQVSMSRRHSESRLTVVISSAPVRARLEAAVGTPVEKQSHAAGMGGATTRALARPSLRPQLSARELQQRHGQRHGHGHGSGWGAAAAEGAAEQRVTTLQQLDTRTASGGVAMQQDQQRPPLATLRDT